MIGTFLLVLSGAQSFLNTSDFDVCPTDAFQSHYPNSDFVRNDLDLNTSTNFFADPSSTILPAAHGFSPQWRRIVGVVGGEMFFAGPSNGNPALMGFDMKNISSSSPLGPLAADIIPAEGTTPVDIWYGVLNPTHDVLVYLDDPDFLTATAVTKTGASPSLQDIAFVDAGSYGPNKRVWFSLDGSLAAPTARLYRGVVDLDLINVTRTVDVTDLGLVTFPPSFIGGKIRAMYADGANNIYASSNDSKVIYKMDMSDPMNPPMVAVEQFIGESWGPLGIVSNGARCRYAHVGTTSTTTTTSSTTTTTTSTTTTTTSSTTTTSTTTSTTTTTTTSSTTTTSTTTSTTTTTSSTLNKVIFDILALLEKINKDQLSASERVQELEAIKQDTHDTLFNKLMSTKKDDGIFLDIPDKLASPVEKIETHFHPIISTILSLFHKTQRKALEITKSVLGKNMAM